MTCIKSIWPAARLAFVVLVGWLATEGAALAQRAFGGAEEGAKQTGGGSYILPYVILILFIGLGMFFVCRPTRRRDRVRPEEYVSIIDDGTLKEE